MFDLEKAERIVVIILLVALSAGLAVTIYSKLNSAIKVKMGSFDIEKQMESDRHEEIGKIFDKVNINQASPADLEKLKGVGKVLAGRIVEYRLSKGRFSSVDGIKDVKGIGEELFNKIKDEISVE